MRRRYIFRGTVQHVGLRYRAVSEASRMKVTGWIRNLPDGTVLMEAQGPEDILDSLAAGILDTRYGRIEVSFAEIPEEAEEGIFRVKLN